MTDFVDPRRSWKLEIAGFLIAMGIVAFVMFGIVQATKRPEPVKQSPRRVVLADSLGRSRTLDSARLVEYGRKLANARGDSLAALLAHRAVVLRTRWRVDTLVQADTVRDSVVVASSDVRTILLADSACVVRADSLAGELVQARYDAQECSEELRKRPTSCSGWSAFGLGFGVGAAATAGVCAMVR